MATDVVMPRLSDSMEEGTILKWLKQPGDEVARGEGLVEVETDKANMTYESDTDGVLTEIVAQEGDTLAIGEVIARIGDASEVDSSGSGEAKDSAEATASGKDDSAGGGTATEQRTKKDKGGEAADDDGEQDGEDEGAAASGEDDKAAANASRGAKETAPAGGNGAAASGNGAGRIKASPVARRMAGELGIELAQLEGSGPGGRIVKADVQAAADAGGTAAPPAEGAQTDEAPPAAERDQQAAPRRSRRASPAAPRARSRSRSSPACSRSSRAAWPSRRPPRPTSRSRSTST